MSGGHDTYRGIMDLYGDFLLGSTRLSALHQGSNQNVHMVSTSSVNMEPQGGLGATITMPVAGEDIADLYIPTQICDGDLHGLASSTVDISQPASGSFTDMLQNPFDPSYEQMIHEPMSSENRTFMITGRDGSGLSTQETDDDQYVEQYGVLSDDAACDSADENAETHPVSIASENLSTVTHKTAQPDDGQTHRFERQAGAEKAAEVEQLSKEDVENFLQNETLIASQSSSQEIRAQHVPHIDMAFCSPVEAFTFYNTYASIVGFSAKRAGNYHRRGAGPSIVTRYTYRCNRAGKVVDKEVLEERRKKRQENRKKQVKVAALACPVQSSKPRNKNTIDITNCEATMVVTLKGDKWIVTSIELQHNHVLSPPGEAKFLRSHKHMTEEEKLLIRTMNSVKLPSRKMMAILAGFRGGISALPYTKKDVSNYRTAIRNETNQNDMMMVIDFFRKRQMEDPRFYYAFRVDDENKVQNIFWADGDSRRFYHLYGDCVSFDTTYKTNKYNLPFAPFVGITGHGHNCLFACAILQNETIETFTWLFQEFLQCMGGKMPLTIITDQDVAMKQAIPAVFAQTKHRNCLFHIKKKAEEKCARCFATKKTLHIEFNDIINKSQTEEEFETLWPEMMKKYKVENVKYFQHMWEIRKSFVPVYFKKDFFPFIHSTARSEGTNAIFKDNVGSTYSIVSFLGEYQRISENIVEKEREQDSKTRTTKPTLWAGSEIELQAAKMYNRNIFYKFQAQLKMTQQIHVEEIEKNVSYEVYKSSMLAELDFRERKFMVMVDWANEDISCICARFQKDGILCCHAIKVLLHLNISVLPDKYFIERWRPTERKDLQDARFNVPLELTADNRHFRYNILSKRMIDLAADACTLTDTYMYLLNKSTKIDRKLSEIRKEAKRKEQEKQAELAGVDKQVPEEAAPEGSFGAGENSHTIYKEPDVAKSKGRPKLPGRQKTLVEEILTKQQITCSHCGDHDHNIKTCKKLAIDKETLQKGKAARKTKHGVATASAQRAAKKQKVAVSITQATAGTVSCEKNSVNKTKAPRNIAGRNGHVDKDISSPLPPRDVQSPRIRKPTQRAIESMLLTPTRKPRKQDR